MIKSASLSLDGMYRWWLRRDWTDEQPMLRKPFKECVFVGLNPSTADDKIDDNTVRIWISLAKRWGYTCFTALNIYPYRSTDPRALLAWSKLVSSYSWALEQNEMVFAERSDLPTILCCGSGLLPGHEYYIEDRILPFFATPPLCLVLTKDGYPHHPRGVSLDTKPIPYPARRRE